MVLPRVVIGGTASGVGKTTIAVGVIAALTARGLRVQPFKAGPDYIDPTYHELAAGRACRNLDTWILPRAAIAACVERAGREADLAVIEGVMGLYDGFGSEDESGSTAQLAKWLAAPVVLVLDVEAMARSAGALALGYQRFDPELNLAGFVVNRLAGASHRAWVQPAIESATGLPVIGGLTRDEALEIPERHLGLIPTVEPGKWLGFVDAARRQVEAHLNLDRILELARAAPPLPDIEDAAPQLSEAAPRPAVRLAVARDEAFSFYYADNLEMLKLAGAEIVLFSPLRDVSLPEADGLYIGGGFPEVYAAGLAANAGMRKSIREFAQAGRPIYAECGGLMYLTERLVDQDGAGHEMVGLLPGGSAMTRRLTLGYREAQAAQDTLLLRVGETIRGHEFHYSEWADRPAGAPWAYEIQPRADGAEARLEGFADGNLLASYVHLHFAARPELAARFVRACRRGAGIVEASETAQV